MISAAATWWAFIQPYLTMILGAAVPLLATLLGAWLREMTLRSKARQAALEVEIQSASNPSLKGEAKLEKALDLMKKASAGNPLLSASSAALKAKVEEAVPAAEKHTDSLKKSLQPPVQVTLKKK